MVKTISFQVSEKDYELIENVAKKLGCSVHSLAKMVVLNYVKGLLIDIDVKKKIDELEKKALEIEQKVKEIENRLQQLSSSLGG